MLRQTMLILCDIVIFALSSFFALWIRFEFSIQDLNNSGFLANIFKVLPVGALSTVVIYAVFGLYNSLWEYAGEREFSHTVFASLLASVANTLILFLLKLAIPRSFIVIQFFILMVLTVVSRFSYRLVRKIREYYSKSDSDRIRTMIIGAGEAGSVIARELERSKYSRNDVVCFIDDNPAKLGKKMYGISIVGTVADIELAVSKYKVKEILFAIPSASAQKRSEILEICSKTDCKLRTLPAIYQLVNGEVNVQKIRDVQIEDLLLRESVSVYGGERNYYKNKTVLVTGGGGSIGSELCRQIALCDPAKLIIFDIYENNAYDIQQELKYQYGDKLDLAVEIGSVRDRERVEGVFSCYKPDIVFHAAAHKHVPLMEHSSLEAIKNNVFGTCNVADMAEKYAADKFILISTDKAVNPTNIMGATKRLCEMLILCRGDSKTSFAAVRFGNVLGSNGSVIPLFKRQIASGGPVTITDKRIIRYFMTISEASQLVMEAGAMAKKGELFVLDMGKPVRIYDLAVNMIRLSGFKPDIDIRIEEIGLRPGEKLYEELLMKTETLDKTDNDMIFIERDATLSREDGDKILAVLASAVEKAEGMSDSPFIKDAIRMTVPTFHDPDELNSTAHQTEEMKLSVGKTDENK